MNKFSYYITTYFILSNKYYNSCHNSHSVYQIYPKLLKAVVLGGITLNLNVYFVSRLYANIHNMLAPYIDETHKL